MSGASPEPTFRPLTREDLPLLHEWLSRPHVAEWWGAPRSLADVEREYGPSIAGAVPDRGYIALLGGVPIGFIQSYVAVGGHREGWWLDEHDPGVRCIDQFLADADQLGRGLGTAMVRAFVRQLFADPEVTRVQTDPAPENVRAIRCYEKAGFRAAREVDTPDGRALLMYCDRRPGAATSESIVRRHPRLAFFALGALTTLLLSGLSVLYRLQILHATFGTTVFRHSRPPWLETLADIMPWMPWVVLAALVAIRVARGPVVRPVAFAAGVLTVHGLAVAALFLSPVFDEYRHRRTFDAAAWRRHEAKEVMWPDRLAMIDDLMERHALRGLSRDSVERLLGPGDSTASWGEWDLVYLLGPERGLIRIDSEWLVVDFDAHGRVREYRLVRD